MMIYRLSRWIGELTSIILGLAIIWFFALNTLLSRQSVDVSGLKPNAQMWFSQAFNGSDAQIGEMQLSWLPASNTILFDASNIVITDKNEKVIQTIARLQTEIPLADAARGTFMPKRLMIEGGAVTWLRGNDGNVVAGLGTPDTVGRLGPVWRGRKGGKAVIGPNVSGVEAVSIANAAVYVIDDSDGLEMTFEDTDIDVRRQGEMIEIKMASYLRKDSTSIPLKFHMTATPDFKSYAVDLSAAGLNPSTLSPRRGRYAVLRDIDTSLDVEMAFKIDAETGLDTADIDLKARAGRIKIGGRNMAFENARYKAKLTADSQVMDILDIALSSERLSFTGAGTLHSLRALNDGDINSSPIFDLRFTDIKIDQTPRFAAPLTLADLSAKGSLDLESRRLDLEALTADFGAYQINTNGRFVRKENGSWQSLAASGSVTGTLLPQDLLSLWPVEFSSGTRRWIDRSVLRGDIHDVVFNVNLTEDVLASGVPGDDNLSIDFKVDNGDVKYISTMTPYTGVSGIGRLKGNRFDLDVTGGHVGELTVTTGRVEIPRLKPKGGDLIIDFKGSGKTADMLALIDQKPFEFASKYGVNPESFEGTGEINLTVTRPLLEYFDPSLVRYEVEGKFENASAPFTLGPNKLKNGFVTLTADKTGMTVKGPVNIGPWQAELNWQETFDNGATPTQYQVIGRMDRDTLDGFGFGFREYFDGEIKLTVDAIGTGLDLASADLTADLTETTLRIGEYWHKSKGSRGQLTGRIKRQPTGSILLENFAMTAPGFDVAGRAELAKNFRLLDLDLKRANIEGFIDASVKAKPDELNEKLSIFVTGRYLDLSPFVTNALQQKDGGIDVPILLTAGLEKLALNEAYIVQNANLLFSHNGAGITNARLAGNTADGEIAIEMVTKERAASRDVHIDIPDASEAAFAFLKLDNITGGRLQIDAQLPPLGTKGALNGTAEVADFKLVNAPILTQMLSIGSLQGILNTMSGEGLKFDYFLVPFSLSDGTLHIRDARVSGPALGMTGDGEIYFAERRLDLDGALVPAYTANSMLGGIPVLGDLLVGKKGEGVFALSYTVKGGFDKTQIAVNPLSALTPGFLRGIFKPKREKLPDDVVAEIEAVKPE